MMIFFFFFDLIYFACDISLNLLIKNQHSYDFGTERELNSVIGFLE